MREMTDIEKRARTLMCEIAGENGSTIERLLADALSQAGGQWTREQPTEEGWYWYEQPAGEMASLLQVLLVYEINDEYWAYKGEDLRRITGTLEFPGQWSGPLHPPLRPPTKGEQDE